MKIKSSVIENKYIKLKTLNIGATIHEIIYKPKKLNLIFNLGSIKNYNKKHPFVGSTCGRFANRIKKAKFEINKKKYFLSKNEGKNLLHGGEKGFDKYHWKKIIHNKKKIVYEIVSKNLDQGFPGNLKVNCIYEIENNNVLIKYNYISDKYTHVNLTNHIYWNLNLRKKNKIYNHKLKIYSDYYLPVNKENIPNGKIKKVSKTNYDFRKLSELKYKMLINNFDYDNTYKLKKRKDNLAANLINEVSKIRVKIYTNQPGLQFYSGHKLNYKNRKKKLLPYQGLCLETQHFPNSPNEKKFPSTLVLPYKKYKYFTKIEINKIVK